MKHVLLILMAFGLVACAKEEGCRSPRMGKGTRLIAFGDSQTAGHASESSDQCGFSYANILAERHDLRLWNTAVAGSEFTSNDQYGKIMSFKFESTDKVIFSVGFNDMSNFQSDAVHLADFKIKLKQAILFTAPQVQTLTMGTAFKPFDWRSSDLAALNAYRQAARDAVAETGLVNVTIGDVGDSIAGNPSFYVDDTWHYNFEGQAVLADDFEGIF